MIIMIVMFCYICIFYICIKGKKFNIMDLVLMCVGYDGDGIFNMLFVGSSVLRDIVVVWKKIIFIMLIIIL